MKYQMKNVHQFLGIPFIFHLSRLSLYLKNVSLVINSIIEIFAALYNFHKSRFWPEMVSLIFLTVRHFRIVWISLFRSRSHWCNLSFQRSAAYFLKTYSTFYCKVYHTIDYTVDKVSFLISFPF